MQILLNTEFVIPVLVGIGCLVFSMRILLRKDADQREPLREDIEGDDYDIPQVLRHEDMEPGRKIFYMLLFAGLGMASITFGLAVLYPFLEYIAKGIIVLTIIISIITNAQIDKKLQQRQNEKIEAEADSSTDTDTES